jgi:hypothetical protein
MLVIFSRNEGLLDIMSLVHFASGIGLGLLFFVFSKEISKKIYYSLGLIILILWEMFEFFLRFLKVYYPLFLENLKFIPSGWADKENFLNVGSDLIVGFAGLLIIYFIFKQPRLKLRKIKKYEARKINPIS